MRTGGLGVALALVLTASLAGCERAQGEANGAGAKASTGAARGAHPLATGGGADARADGGTEGGIAAIAAVPLGDLAGAPESGAGATIDNPYRDDPQAVQQGHRLFEQMNCAGCHGYGAPGGMGPNLTDTYWRYGGAPVNVFKSIYEGRPQGMPAWNRALPPAEIWKLVAYIQSLGGTYTARQYEASVQGDRVGDIVAPEVQRTLTGQGAREGPSARGASGGTPSADPRPDAAGTAPGSRP